MEEKPKSEIQKELIQWFDEMQMLVDRQSFGIHDARLFMERVYNYIRKIEDLIESRDNWKRKYEEVSHKN